MANEIVAANQSIVSDGFNINQLLNLPNTTAVNTYYTTANNEFLELFVIRNDTNNRTLEIRHISDVGNTSVILSLAANANIYTFNTANRLIVPPNHTIRHLGGGQVINGRIVLQGTRFYSSP